MPSDQVSTTAQDAWILDVFGIRIENGQAQWAGDIVKLQKSRLAWDGLRKSVQSQLGDIERSVIAAVAKHNEDPDAEEEYDASDLAAKVQSIYGILQTLDERLIDKLDEALNADGIVRARLNAEAGQLVAEYRAAVASNALLASIDANGFTSTSIRDATQKTLDVLASQL